MIILVSVEAFNMFNQCMRECKQIVSVRKHHWPIALPKTNIEVDWGGHPLKKITW